MRRHDEDWQFREDSKDLAGRLCSLMASGSCMYNIGMIPSVKWDEAKRRINLRKHGLDFADASEVLDSIYRLDVESVRGDEVRVLSFSYVLKVKAVLTVVHTERDGSARVISFRRASAEEREAYREWLENEFDES